MPKILIIEDNNSIADLLSSFLTGNGFDVVMSYNGREGLEQIKREKFDLILTDVVMPEGISGIDVLKEISASNSDIPVIVMTAFATVETAVQAMKLGAFDYITKPFNLDELLMTIDRALKTARLKKENLMLKKQLKKEYSYKGLIGISLKMQKVYDLIAKIADTDCTVLITGESGTGKELIAKTLHYNSSRANGPFVPINCAAIPANLLESELFGHEKGAFTGAVNARMGRFELANNGTLFLDEIGDLDPSLQVKLLRVIQEREFERVGGVKTIKVDVRILAATNKDLEELTKEGKFREDLYYRLNVVQLHLPALRERIEDITLLLDYYVNEFSKKMKKEPLVFSEDVMEYLLRYNWPGNVRELRNLIEGLVVLTKDNVVKPGDLPERLLQTFASNSSKLIEKNENLAMLDYASRNTDIPEEGVDLEQTLYTAEKELILKALKKAGGKKSKAAKLLHMNRTTLIEKLKRMRVKFEPDDN